MCAMYEWTNFDANKRWLKRTSEKKKRQEEKLLEKIILNYLRFADLAKEELIIKSVIMTVYKCEQILS